MVPSHSQLILWFLVIIFSFGGKQILKQSCGTLMLSISCQINLIQYSKHVVYNLLCFFNSKTFLHFKERSHDSISKSFREAIVTEFRSCSDHLECFKMNIYITGTTENILCENDSVDGGEDGLTDGRQIKIHNIGSHWQYHVELKSLIKSVCWKQHLFVFYITETYKYLQGTNYQNRIPQKTNKAQSH